MEVSSDISGFLSKLLKNRSHPYNPTRWKPSRPNNTFFPQKEVVKSIGNPAGIGQGTGLGLRERERDGIGWGHYRLRAIWKDWTGILELTWTRPLGIELYLKSSFSTMLTFKGNLGNMIIFPSKGAKNRCDWQKPTSRPSIPLRLLLRILWMTVSLRMSLHQQKV